jgi:hypothetical protein
MKKVYLRIVIPSKIGEKENVDLFEGDIKIDKVYWKKYHNQEVRYFELKEVK